MRTITTFALVLFLASVGAGCRHAAPPTAVASIRYRIFETPTDVVDAVIPRENRTQIEGSSYWIASVSPTNLAVLLDAMTTDAGLLADKQRTISWWPKVADTWAYSRADGTLLGGGVGVGFLGVHADEDVRKIRIEYDVTHTINTSDLVQSKVVYEGAVPPLGVLIALRPFERSDGTPLAHILAYEVTDWR